DVRARLLFDDFVDEGKHHRRNFDAERLGSLEIDEQVEFCGLHNRQVDGLFALEDFTNVSASLPVGLPKVRAIARESAGFSVLVQIVDRGNRVARRQCNELIPPGQEKRIGVDKKRAGAPLNEQLESCIDVILCSGVEYNELQP